ncbi:MAG: TetR/AcrR family transcriptional regulator [Clostridia bacterium]|nr:TetR/AcrR family transcriptional regulator [Clostridia bacterium]
MYKICKIEESCKRQREIEDVLLNLMLEKHYDDISVSEICEKANMPRKSFYRYFDGKEGVKQALLYHTLVDFNSFHLEKHGLNYKLYEEFETLFSFWKSKTDLLEAFDKSGLLGLIVESTTTYAMNGFDDIKKYMGNSDLNEKIMVYQFLICGLMTMMINWYRSGFAESVPNIARTATKIITKPLFENLSRTE